MPKVYRFIEWKGMLVSNEQYPRVEEMLVKAGWEPLPTHRHNGVCISPRTKPYESTEDIDVLYKLAQYMPADATIVLEVDKQIWMHLVYDGKGGCTSTEIPIRQ